MACARILVVEDHEPFRRFILSTLQTRPELHVICEVSDGFEAVQKAEEQHPDLILLDIGLPGQNGVEAARQIRRLAPDAKIIFVTQEMSTAIVEETLRLGAQGYVVKKSAGRDLLAAVEAVMCSKQFVSATLRYSRQSVPAL
jgi:two-component system, NarL family, response regulator NreC